MRRYVWGLVLAGVFATSAWSGSTSAQVPAGITQQGRLLDSDGSPVQGTVQMEFTIYDDPTASDVSNVLWSDTFEVTLDEGYFSLRLGDDTPFPATVFDGSERYLGLKIGSDAEMSPRERITSVPYAFIANDAVGDIHPTSVTVGGTKVIDEDGEWVGKVPYRPNSSLLQRVTGVEQNSAGASNRTVSCPSSTFATGGGCLFTAAGTAINGYIKASYPTVNASDKPNGWTCRAQGVDVEGNPDASGTVTPYAVCIAD